MQVLKKGEQEQTQVSKTLGAIMKTRARDEGEGFSMFEQEVLTYMLECL